jgi:hypothetical protein
MSNRALERILRLAPPPGQPIDADLDASNESAFGDFPLPEDYVRLVARYGRGSFAEFLQLRSPFAAEDCCRPERTDEGVLWATTTNGDRVLWSPQEAPDGWRTVVLASRSAEPTQFDATATEFLAGWLEGTLDVACFPPRDEWFEPSFETAHPTAYRAVFIAFLETPFEERVQRLAREIGARVRTVVPHQDGYSVAVLRMADGTKLQLRDNKGHGARLDLSFRPAREEAVRGRVVAALRALDWQVWRVQRADGEPDWEGVAQPKAYRAPAGDPLDEPLRALTHSLRMIVHVRSLAAPGPFVEQMLAEALSEARRVRALGWNPEQRPLSSDVAPVLLELLGR